MQSSHTGLENRQPTGDAGANKFDARLAAIPTTLTGGNDHDTLLGAKALTAFSEAMMSSLAAWAFGMALTCQDSIAEQADVNVNVAG